VPRHAEALREDLGLDVLAATMAAGDGYLLRVALPLVQQAAENDVGTILHRQAVLRDCMRNEAVVRALYALSVRGAESKRDRYIGFLSRHPTGVLYASLRAMRGLVDLLRELRQLTLTQERTFTSPGFRSFFATIREQLEEDYLRKVEEHLHELEFAKGMLISARLGRSGDGVDHVLRVPHADRRSLLERVLRRGPPQYSFRIADRDEAGARILSDLRSRGANRVANALAQSTDHIFGFFEILRAELGFYLGCLNLHAALRALDVPVCFPAPRDRKTAALQFRGLCDPCLALSAGQGVTGNNVDATGKELLVVTGANQGGKSTFLRSLGLAQLMLQSGMFVTAESFEASVCTGLFTHFRREEDARMESGKLDEELSRMSDIVDDLSHGAVVLFNESFSSTNEREGSEIAWQVVRALLDKGVRVHFVTHLHTFARAAFRRCDEVGLSLVAERKEDGTRTFRMVEGEPGETSHGEDLYRKVFGPDPEEASVP
jgi:DNA mismatch repair ATPase MutS